MNEIWKTNQDRDKEFIRAEIYYFIYKACNTEEEMKDNCLLLDRYKSRH